MKNNTFNLADAIANNLLIDTSNSNNIGGGSIATIVIGSCAFLFFLTLFIIALVNTCCYDI